MVLRAAPVAPHWSAVSDRGRAVERRPGRRQRRTNLLDVIVGNRDSGTVSVFPGVGSGLLGPPVDLAGNATQPASGRGRG